MNTEQQLRSEIARLNALLDSVGAGGVGEGKLVPPAAQPAKPSDMGGGAVAAVTDLDCEAAHNALDSLDDLARMAVGVDAKGPRWVLRGFINKVAAAPKPPTTQPADWHAAQVISYNEQELTATVQLYPRRNGKAPVDVGTMLYTTTQPPAAQPADHAATEQEAIDRLIEHVEQHHKIHAGEQRNFEALVASLIIAARVGKPLAAQPTECPNLNNCEGQCFQCQYFNGETGAMEYPAAQPADSLGVNAAWEGFCRTADYRRCLEWVKSGQAPGALFVAFRSGLNAATQPQQSTPAVQYTSFAELYADNAAGIAIEHIKIGLEKLEAALASTPAVQKSAVIPPMPRMTCDVEKALKECAVAYAGYDGSSYGLNRLAQYVMALQAAWPTGVDHG